MAYPDKVLSNDEQIVEHLHPHWITLVPATLWFLVICTAGGFGIGFSTGHGTVTTVLIIAIIVVGLGLLLWLSFAPWVEWRTTHYVFTDHRVLIRRGVLRHTGRDIALQRISDVGFTQSLLDRIVKAGSLTIESASEHGQETLENIPNSERQQQLLNRLIETDGNRRAREAYSGTQGYPPPGTPGYPASGTAGYPPPGTPGYPTTGAPGYPPPGAPGYPTQQYPQPGQQPYPPTQQVPPSQ